MCFVLFQSIMIIFQIQNYSISIEMYKNLVTHTFFNTTNSSRRTNNDIQIVTMLHRKKK